ncbi:hypothetical protein RhiJN_02684 [Ceratobasidium sp. AG-Ba]|nr:hypothetical protein RhiJN_02684 [Ceratobasidium sp. AG-Ba]
MADPLGKRQAPTTLFVSPTFAIPTATLFPGTAVGTATDLATNALPTQLVFDSSAANNPLGAVTTAPVADPAQSKVDVVTSTAPPANSTPTSGPTTEKNDLPVAAIIMAIFAAGAIASLLVFLWCRKRARRRGHTHSRVESHDMRGPPAGDVLRKLGPASNYEKSDPFSDANEVAVAVDPFADPEKGDVRHNRSGSDSFLSMTAPRQPYTHAVSASTGSSASSKMRKKEMDDARDKDMMALNNLVRALDQKERRAEQEGRDRKSLPPIELFKAALVR